MWIVCITSVRHVLTVNGYGGRQTKENEKSWCFKGWETLVDKKVYQSGAGFICRFFDTLSCLYSDAVVMNAVGNCHFNAHFFQA